MERDEAYMRDIGVDEIIHGMWANDYEFENINDLAVAALVKTVLNDLDETHRRELLERIVSKEMKEYREAWDLNGDTMASSLRRTQSIPRGTWLGVDRDIIANLINEGKGIDISIWNEASHNRAYKRTVRFLKHDFLPNIDGAKYVREMPAELARFLTDCWLNE
jgi:hypothetical protein